MKDDCFKALSDSVWRGYSTIAKRRINGSRRHCEKI